MDSNQLITEQHQTEEKHLQKIDEEVEKIKPKRRIIDKKEDKPIKSNEVLNVL